tara:strand:+ start:374 stop:535 length:162 start_codon:yes stop_codon:yes gene_type:complete
LTVVFLLLLLSGCEDSQVLSNKDIKPFAMGPKVLPKNEIPDIKLPVNVNVTLK